MSLIDEMNHDRIAARQRLEQKSPFHSILDTIFKLVVVLFFGAMILAFLVRTTNAPNSSNPVAAAIAQVAPKQTIRRSTSMKPGQQFTISGIPQNVRITVNSMFPLNISMGDCRASQTTSFQEDCIVSDGRLEIIDARPSILVLGRYNRVDIDLTY